MSQIIKPLLKVALTILIGMSIYETAKQLIVPSVTIVQSHIITVIFTTTIGTFVSYLALMNYKKIQEEFTTKDYLTGLYNRYKLDESLEYKLMQSKRYSTVFGIIMIDIDYFKTINDNYGHQAGDIILKEFAKILKDNSRETDIVGRWGGEEFLIIVENIDKDNILKLAEKLRVIVENYNFSFVKNKTASFGVSVYSPGDDITSIVNKADKALYNAKDSGRNCVRIV
jgi:diguanylate cyclase (GGDEF)-like protein